MTENEATSIRFTIDHYIPSSEDESLKSVYTNLYWTCDLCNSSKGDFCPPPEARDAGLRFYRADHDIYTDHFTCKGSRLTTKTKIGYLTEQVCELNRQQIRQIRELRRSVYDCDEYIRDGVKALKAFPIDELPPTFRAMAIRSIDEAETTAEEMASVIEDILVQIAKSNNIDPDPERIARSKEKANNIKQLEGLFAGSWRGRSTKQSKGGGDQGSTSGGGGKRRRSAKNS